MVRHILLKLESANFKRIEKAKKKYEKKLGLNVTWEAFLFNSVFARKEKEVKKYGI